ncbi:MAG TPA: PKD domain-containing protein [Aequorivita sp.]|nr:PKD domain-containing protein [Aequorivita sp.]
MRNFIIKLGFLLLIIFSFTKMGAQNISQDTVTRSAPIFYDVMGNQVEFNPQMPPLNQVAGAPKAFYTYYWEFGDGNFSFKEKPKHNYKKKGEFTARLWSTNNYDNGKPPTSRPETIKIESNLDKASSNISSENEPDIFQEDEHLIIKTNRDPLPNQEMVLITSYKNTKNYTTSGSIYLFYNDNHFKNDNFIIEDTRLHHGENIITEQPTFASQTENNPSLYFLANKNNQTISRHIVSQDTTRRLVLPVTLEESKNLYRNHQLIEFHNMQPGEERHIFRTLKTTPEMLKDTSAIVTLRTIYVPDKNYGDHTVKDTELEIVTSHDPNKMSSNGTILNYRLVRYKKVKFKVKFQNDGEGPANTIRLEVDTPEMFDKSTLEVLDMYPECPICPKEREVNYSCLDTISKDDKLIFTFKNIHLPGTAQKNVKDRDSTKGFVRYALKFGDNFHKKKTRSRTAIYFDKNEPIITNYSTTQFLPGISIGAKAGYIYTPSKDKSREVFAGITVSPYKSYRGYFQSEFYISAASFEGLKNFETSDLNDVGIESIERFSEKNKENNITAYLVPVSYRYNLNNFLAVGAGVQLKLDFQSKTVTETTGDAYLNIPGRGEIRDREKDSFQKTECTENFSNFNSGVFIGVNAGGVRIGPSVGVRYVFNFNEPTSQIQAYVIWKF